MSTKQVTQNPSDVDFDLSALTHHLEAELLPRGAQPTERHPMTSKEKFAIVAPPEAIVTLGLVICAGALWLVRVLPY